MPKEIKIGNEEYEVIPPAAVSASKIISDMHTLLGRPDDPFSPQGEKLMHIIIAVWEDLYPREAMQWYEDRKEYQKEEMSVREQVNKQTGRSLASIPLPIYRLMRKVFPNYKMDNRDDFIKLVGRYPLFRMANRV